MQEYRGGQGTFRGLERLISLRCPNNRRSLGSSQRMKRGEVLGHVGNESSIIIDHPQETLDSNLGGRGRELEEIIYSGREWPDTIWCYPMPKVLHFRSSENTFLLIDTHSIELQELKKLSEVLKMGSDIGACDKDVIEINKGEVDITEYAVHQALECLGGILKSKRHPEKFEEAEGGNDCRLRYVVSSHWYLVKTTN